MHGVGVHGEIRDIWVSENIGDNEGLEFLNRDTLYMVNNAREMIRKVRLSDDYLRGEVVKKRTSKQFRIPTAVSLAPMAACW